MSRLKLQSLLYLAQAGYADWSDGRPLIPSNFVVREVGPLGSNTYCAIEHDLPGSLSMVCLRKSWRLSNSYGAHTVCSR